MKHNAFHDARLTPQENKAVEMLLNGYRRAEIADELDVDVKHVSTVLSRARKKGVDVPKMRAGSPYRGSIPIEKLEKLRADLKARGFLGDSLWQTMSERTGLSISCLRVRLWRWDNNIQPKREEGQAA